MSLYFRDLASGNLLQFAIEVICYSLLLNMAQSKSK